MPCSERLFSVDQDDHHATCKKDTLSWSCQTFRSLSLRMTTRQHVTKTLFPGAARLSAVLLHSSEGITPHPNSSSFAELIGCAGGCCSVSILMFHSTNTGLHSLALQRSVLLPLLPDQFLHQPIVRVMLITYPCTQPPPPPPTAWFEPCCSSLLRWAMSSWV